MEIITQLSPFKDNKEILRPYLEYFCFSGTGKADSKNQADSLVKFKTFNDTNTWKIIQNQKQLMKFGVVYIFV